MGPPHGLLGQPTTLASRLKSIWSHFLVKRLQSSHVTIEIEIPFHNLAATDYFRAYMDQIADVMSPKKFGNRLSIKHTEEPTEALYNADPAHFYAAPTDVDQAWYLLKQDNTKFPCHVVSLVDPDYRLKKKLNSQYSKKPTQEQINNVEFIFRGQKRAAMDAQRVIVTDALKDARRLIDCVRKFEQMKMPAHARAPVLDSPNAKSVSVPSSYSNYISNYDPRRSYVSGDSSGGQRYEDQRLGWPLYRPAFPNTRAS